MRSKEHDEDDRIMIRLLISKLPFFCPYAMVLFNFSEGPNVNEPTITVGSTDVLGYLTKISVRPFFFLGDITKNSVRHYFLNGPGK